MTHRHDYTFTTVRVVKARTGEDYYEWKVFRDGYTVANGKQSTKADAELAAKQWIDSIVDSVSEIARMLGVSNDPPTADTPRHWTPNPPEPLK